MTAAPIPNDVLAQVAAAQALRAPVDAEVVELRRQAHASADAGLRDVQRPLLAALLGDVEEMFTRFVAFPSEHARVAVVAWVAHCWAVEAFESTPRLLLLSPEKGSGKTRTLEVLELLCPNPLHTVNVSAAALFRKVADGDCTLLLDEADTYLGTKVAAQHEELRGLINAGHRRGAVAYRCVIDKGVQVQEFPAFAPAAIAGIGDLPDTILDRGIPIAMKRRAPNEHVEQFRRRWVLPVAKELTERLLVWAAAAHQHLSNATPDMPEGIVDRAADVWEALIIIGDAAGDPWSSRVREAATVINGQRQERDPSLGVRLLSDCRAVFGDADRQSTEQLLDLLHGLDEAPWGSLRGEPINARFLAKMLKPYGIKPGDHKFGESTRKGYLRADFHDPWARYLPPPREGQQGQPAQPVAEVAEVAHSPGEDSVDLDSYEAAYPELFETEGR